MLLTISLKSHITVLSTWIFGLQHKYVGVYNDRSSIVFEWLEFLEKTLLTHNKSCQTLFVDRLEFSLCLFYHLIVLDECPF